MRYQGEYCCDRFESSGKDKITDKTKAHEFPKTNLDCRAILDSIGKGIFTVDANGLCDFCNSGCLSLLGYKSEQDLLGKDIHSLIHNKNSSFEFYPHDSCKILGVIKSGEAATADNDVFFRANGTFLAVRYLAYPRYRSGKVSGAVVLFSDMAGRKQDHETSSVDKIKAMLLSNIKGMAYRCYYNADWTMQYVSEGCLELTGYSPESLLYNNKTSFNELVSPQFREELWNGWAKAAAEKTVFKGEYQIKTACGETKWVYEQGQGVYENDGKITALEGLIIDITAQKKREEEIEYLLCHDYMTDVYNRIYFERQKSRLDLEHQLPLSVIVTDINGVKLINDAFGHESGDRLIVETAKLLHGHCREQDVIARTGGDEFCILMPKTDCDAVSKIYEEITNSFEDYNAGVQNESSRISLSLGYNTKKESGENLTEIIKIAENYMYKRKLLERTSLHSNIITSIKATMREKSHGTEEHEERLAEMARLVGARLHLSQTELDELVLLATLHDIGKVGIDDRILNKPGKLDESEWVEMKKHPEIGYRIAMATDELKPIAEYILCHQERWDGKGYPRCLSGNDIPLLSRIIAVIDSFDAMTNDRAYRKALSKETAVTELKKNSGTQFDPQITSLFLKMQCC